MNYSATPDDQDKNDTNHKQPAALPNTPSAGVVNENPIAALQYLGFPLVRQASECACAWWEWGLVSRRNSGAVAFLFFRTFPEFSTAV